MSTVNTKKRNKLSDAFSTPLKRVEVASTVAVPAASNKITVCMLPPPITKSMNSGVPAATLKVHNERGPLITIANTKKPPFAFNSPTIDGAQVNGFGFQGYTTVKGGDTAPPTAACGTTYSAGSQYNLKNGRLYSSFPRDAPSVKEDTAVEVPMSDLGGTWDTKLPTVVLASNTNAFFDMSSFHEAKSEAAKKIEIVAAGAVCLIATAEKKLQTEPTVLASTPAYLDYLSKFVLLFNPPPDSKYGARVCDVIASSEKRPIEIVLQHPVKQNLTRKVQVWQSVLDGIGISLNQLRNTPLIVYIDASLDTWTTEGKTKLMVVAIATPPPDLSTYIAFSKSSAVKAYFNDIGHVAEDAKKVEEMVPHILMNEGRAVPLGVCRVGVMNTLLLNKNATLSLLKSHAESLAPTDATKEVLDLVNTATEEATVAALLAIDKMPSSCVDLASVMELLLTSDGDTMPNEETIAATFLHALLAGGKEAVTFLSPMVYGWNNVSFF